MGTLVNIQYNLSSYLLTPMITINPFNVFWNINTPKEELNIVFLNSYYKENTYNKYHTDYLIFITFIVKDEASCAYLDSKILKMSNNSKCKLLDNFNLGSTICYVFEVIDNNLKKDYDFIINGKYSKISSNYKQKILAFNHQYNINKFINIFSKNINSLKNLHKNLGCMKNICKCNYNNFKQCNNFKDFDFDYNNQEIISKFSKNEILSLNTVLPRYLNLIETLNFFNKYKSIN